MVSILINIIEHKQYCLTIPHNRALSNDWFRSYLKGRQKFVSNGNQASTVKEIVSGVPQGSVLGSLLFLTYINDLHSCLKYSKPYHQADDTSVTLSDRSQETLAKRVNYDLRKLSMWLRANKFSLNIEKTELVVFRRQNTKLNNSFKIKLDGKRLFPTSSVKYLGVLLDEHLTWSSQISHVQIKLNRAIEYSASQDTKQTFMYSKQYTIFFLELIFFMPAS